MVPGSAAESLLLQAVIQGEMPPEPEKKLPDQVIADFVRWIESGAVDPRDQPPIAEEAAELSWQTVLNERRNWWSLQPVAENDPPEGGGATDRRFHFGEAAGCGNSADGTG